MKRSELIVSLAAFALAAISISGCDLPPEDTADDNVAQPVPPSVDPVDPVSPEEPEDPEEQEFYFCETNPGGSSQGCCTTTSFETASAPVSGMLIKSSGPMVYYFASNGKRYTFPTAATLVSWYEPYHSEALLTGESDVCAQVVEIPADTMAELPIGGNVTFRPGSYITGISTDPMRWVVGRGGHVLRRLATPEMAEDIYPGEVAERTRILPDAFFTNYVGGDDVTDPAEFNAAAEFASACLEDELGITSEEPASCEVPADLDLSGTAPIFSLSSIPTSTWTSGDSVAARITLTAPVEDIEFHQFLFVIQTNSGASIMPVGIREVGLPSTMAGVKTVECDGVPCNAFTLTISLDEPIVVAGGTSKTVDLIVAAFGVASDDWFFTKLAIKPTSVGCSLDGDGPYDIDGQEAWTVWSDGDWFVEGSEWQLPLDGHLLVAL